jgi:hypothetical protein
MTATDAIPRDCLRQFVRYWRHEYDRGGHFAAMVEPDLLVGDIRAFFRELRAAGGTVVQRGCTSRKVTGSVFSVYS